MLQSARQCGRYPHTSGRYPHTFGSATPCHGGAAGLERKKRHTPVCIGTDGKPNQACLDGHHARLARDINASVFFRVLRFYPPGWAPCLPCARYQCQCRRLRGAAHRAVSICCALATWAHPAAVDSLHSAWGTSQGCMLCLVWKHGDACHQCNSISMRCGACSPVKEMAEASGWVVR